jgi:hypothetical protein
MIFQDRCVGIPKDNPFAGAPIRQKDVSIVIPRFGFFRRARNGIEDTLLSLGACQ